MYVYTQERNRKTVIKYLFRPTHTPHIEKIVFVPLVRTVKFVTPVEIGIDNECNNNF